MNENLKLEIIESGKDYFRTKIIPNHLNNLNKLKLDSFKINPDSITNIGNNVCIEYDYFDFKR